MKILFYLPVIVPRWFERLFVPLIEVLAGEHEVHILAPAPWSGTGLGERELALCAHLPNVHYHIVEDADHPSMRDRPAQREAIVAFVDELGADYTICRSADFETVKAFPGIVRHLTEGGADPLRLPVDTFHFTKNPFDHGVMPDLDADQTGALSRMIAPVWDGLIEAGLGDTGQRDYLRDWAKLPDDRPVIFVPLEYEDEENFFAQHRIGARPNAKLVQELAEIWGDRVFFAFTNHPLNIARIDNSAVEEMIASYSDCAGSFPFKTPLGTPTSALLTANADAMLVSDSKMFALAGAMGTPLIRQSRFQTGEWLNAHDRIDGFLEGYAAGTALAPDEPRAKLWFAFHTANNLINLEETAISAADILARLDKPVDPGRWERNFAFFAKDW